MKILTSLVRMANASEDREFVKCLADNPDYSRLSFEKAIHVIQRENLVSEHVIQDLRKLLQEVRNSKYFSNLNTKMRWCFDHRFRSFNCGYSTVIKSFDKNYELLPFVRTCRSDQPVGSLSKDAVDNSENVI